MSTEEEKKKTKKKILFIGLGTITAGVAGFFGWQWWRSRSESASKSGYAQNNSSTASNGGSYTPQQDSASSTYHSSAAQANDGFPLRPGSKGAKVKALQQALIAKYGASVLPRYGADGSFGNEVASALKKEGLPPAIDSVTYNMLVGSTTASGGTPPPSSGMDAAKIASSLHDAIDNENYDAAISALKQMHSVKDYEDVRTEFEKSRIGLVKETPVNALLQTFSSETQKVNIRLEFQRMGLIYDSKNDKWSLPSLSGIPYKLVTTAATEITDRRGKVIKVKQNTRLGYPVGIRNGWLYFFPFNARVLLKVRKEHVRVSNN